MSQDKHGCPHCGQPLFREGGGKLKARTTMVVLHKAGGDVEVNCGGCGRGVVIGTLTPGELRKGEPPRPVVPRP